MGDDALAAWLVEAWCHKTGIDVAWLNRCRDGLEEMPEEVAARVAVVSKGRVQVTYWRKLRRLPEIVGPDEAIAPPAPATAVEIPRREGRPPAVFGNPHFHVWIREIGITSGQYAASRDMPQQRLSHYTSGSRAVPLDFALNVEKESVDPNTGKPRVPWTSWRWVRDYATSREWTYGDLGRPPRLRPRTKTPRNPA